MTLKGITVPEKLEQHVGTIMQIMVIALLGWSLKTSVDLTGQVGVLLVRVAALETLVSQGTTDRYRGSDAARDLAAVRTEMGYIERRVNRLEAKHGERD